MSAGASGAVRRAAPIGSGLVRAGRALSAVARVDDVLILQGTPLCGALFALGGTVRAALPDLALVLAGSCLLVAHVFLLNDWAGREGDRRDPHRSGVGTVSSRTLGSVSVLALLLAFLFLAPFGLRTLVLAAAVAATGALYSSGPRPAKGVPVVASCLHVAGGVLHFHLGAAPFGPPGAVSLALSALFGLTFAAGHLVQEVRDHDADRLNGIRTSAVVFGRRPAFAAALALFVLADALLVGMAFAGAVPRALALAAPFLALHLAWSVAALRAGLTFESVRRLRLRYRALYAVIGALTLVAALAR